MAGLASGASRRVAALRNAEALREGKVLFVGAGSSRYAAEIAAEWFRGWKLDADVRSASGVGGPPASGVLLVVTQSGATRSTLRLLDQAGGAGIFRIVVTNEAESPAAGSAELALITEAGPERAIPATKTFTSALVALRVLGLEWASVLGRRPAPSGTPDDPAGVLEDAVARESAIAARIAAIEIGGPWFFLGSGIFSPLAREGALKLMETALLPAVPVPAGELAHGPAALLRPTTPVVLLSANDPLSRSEERSLAAARAAGAPVFRFGGPGIPAELQPFAVAPALQLLAFCSGRKLGRDVDAPRGLEKAVRDD
ncbi:MAG: SIS domain-containing protein [Acidobacteriota bacterium]|nr:SIS domain-containing protein [Acidobacteriota bacterium]